MHKDEVIAYFGGVGKTAKALGMSHASVSGWPDPIPRGRAFEVEVVTNSSLKVDLSLYQKTTAPSA
ncbi:Cro/CI family transcriptional regulator [Yersinia mollaretii]|uniref:Cro/CI family transcriptional regulator n=1 Tax=Yersinia mollaretii TaxID=33060 RepID=UPI0011AA4025|nr:Cro/CI family transcriptional regulator [Yersinia mollaretii]